MSDRREEILNKHDSSRKYIEQTCRPELFSAMDEYANELCLDLIQWMIDKGMFATRVIDGDTLLYYRGEYITKESLFNSFL